MDLPELSTALMELKFELINPSMASNSGTTYDFPLGRFTVAWVKFPPNDTCWSGGTRFRSNPKLPLACRVTPFELPSNASPCAYTYPTLIAVLAPNRCSTARLPCSTYGLRKFGTNT